MKPGHSAFKVSVKRSGTDPGYFFFIMFQYFIFNFLTLLFLFVFNTSTLLFVCNLQDTRATQPAKMKKVQRKRKKKRRVRQNKEAEIL